MIPQRPRYLAYMLRLWQAGEDETPAWRISLESPHTGERHGFGNLAQLVAFLEEQTETTPNPDPQSFQDLEGLPKKSSSHHNKPKETQHE